MWVFDSEYILVMSASYLSSASASAAAALTALIQVTIRMEAETLPCKLHTPTDAHVTR